MEEKYQEQVVVNNDLYDRGVTMSTQFLFYFFRVSFHKISNSRMTYPRVYYVRSIKTRLEHFSSLSLRYNVITILDNQLKWRSSSTE